MKIADVMLNDSHFRFFVSPYDIRSRQLEYWSDSEIIGADMRSKWN